MGDNRPVRGGVQISRRGACGILAGIAAVPLASAASPALAGGFGASRPKMRYIVTDMRHPESLQFAAPFARAGVARLEVTDGLTKLWRQALVPLWENEGGAIAGLTRRETWECLAEQGRSRRRRSILTARHAFSADGELAGHALSGPLLTTVDAAMLERCGAAWPAMMADVALRCSTAGRGLPSSHAHVAGPAHGARPAGPASLVSWVIA